MSVFHISDSMHGWPNSLEILKELGETTPLITHPILQTILQWQRPVWPCSCSTSSTTRPPRTTAPPVQGAGETRPGKCHVSRMSWMIRPMNSLQMMILHPDFISISHGNRSPCFFYDFCLQIIFWADQNLNLIFPVFPPMNLHECASSLCPRL